MVGATGRSQRRERGGSCSACLPSCTAAGWHTGSGALSKRMRFSRIFLSSRRIRGTARSGRFSRQRVLSHRWSHKSSARPTIPVGNCKVVIVMASWPNNMRIYGSPPARWSIVSNHTGPRVDQVRSSTPPVTELVRYQSRSNPVTGVGEGRGGNRRVRVVDATRVRLISISLESDP